MFNNDGLLPAGLHEYEPGPFERDFVAGFATSQTRKPLFLLLGEVLEEIKPLFMPVELWINGSYVTSKVNPNDIDLLMFLDLDDFVKFASKNPSFEYLRRKYLGQLDMYLALAVNDETKARVDGCTLNIHVNRRNYWKGQFGFDRQDKPKGFIVFNSSVMQDFIKEDHADVSN